MPDVDYKPRESTCDSPGPRGFCPDFESYQPNFSMKIIDDELVENGNNPMEGVKSIPEKMPPAQALPPQAAEATGNILSDRLKNMPTAQEMEGGLADLLKQTWYPTCDKPNSSFDAGINDQFQQKYCGKPNSSTIGQSLIDFIPPLPSDPNFTDESGSVQIDKDGQPYSLNFDSKDPYSKSDPGETIEAPLREKFWLGDLKKKD